MTSGMDDGEEQRGIGELAVHPKVLVKRKPPDLGTDPSHYRPADGEENEHAVNAQHQPSTTRNPHRVLEQVERRQARVILLLDPVRVVVSHRS